MSSAPARFLPNIVRAIRGMLWAALFAVLAAGAAGLVAQANHAPGSPARAELTYAADAALSARLDQATVQLQAIATHVEQLAEEAKTALAQLASSDPATLQASLQHGGEVAAAIDAETIAVLAVLAGLPGDGPEAALEYSNDTLVRRAAILAALDAAASLNASWQQVTARAGQASQLTILLAEHDQIVLDAAAKGRDHAYAEAATMLDQAILAVSNVKSQRTTLIAGTEPTVLDEWILRNGAFDVALQALYLALVASGGKQTPAVVQARRAELEAQARLPPDRRTIIVIVAEIARGGLTQAVLAIEDARGRIDDALAEAGTSPAAGESPLGTGSPGDTGSPTPS
jgi:hypothetical protein